jgi:hypothetical protein
MQPFRVRPCHICRRGRCEMIRWSQNAGVGNALLLFLTACSPGSAVHQVAVSSSTPISSGRLSAPDQPRQTSAVSVTPTARSTSARCAETALTVGAGPLLSPASGEHGDIYELQNTGGTLCTLSGYPTVTLTSGANALRFHYVRGGGSYVTRKPPAVVSLPPGAIGYFLVAKYRCDVQSSATATAVLVRLPGQRTTHVLPTQTTAMEHGAAVLTYCTGNGDPDPGDTVVLSPIVDSVQHTAED